MPLKNPFYAVKRFISRFSIASRLAMSFFSIILLLFIVAVYTNIAIRNIHNLNVINTEYILARRERVYMIQGEFNQFRFVLRDTFQSPSWIEDTGRHERFRKAHELIDSHTRMTESLEIHSALLYSDPFTNPATIAETSQLMSQAQSYFQRAFSHFETYFFNIHGIPQDRGNAIQYIERADSILSRILDITNESIGVVLEESNARIARTMNITIAIVIFAILASTGLAITMTMAYKERILGIEAQVSNLTSDKFDVKSYENLKKSDDEISKMFTSVVDDFKNREEHERERLVIAEENSQAKSRFLARMSHEIRTPLTAVLGIAEIQLQNPNNSSETEESLAKIHQSASLLLKLVNDILDLSRIESGKLVTTNDTYEVSSLIIDVVQMHLIHVGSKEIDFKLNADENLPAYLIGDELRIRQILNNLLSNAFKYTEKGSVKFEMKRLPHPQENMITLEIKISDTGYGIDSENLKNISEEYTRYHEAEFRSVEGSGLGMPIVFNLLQLMSGQMTIESNVGMGTVITVQLPQALAGNEVIGKDNAQNLSSVDKVANSLVKKASFDPEPMPYGKVLIVDDIDTNIYVASGLLKFYDLQIETCTSGRAAIELVKQGRVYDIVFMDQMMPEMDGIQATGIIRSLGYTHPIVALTANALIGQAEHFLNNGFDAFVSKPIQIVQLDTQLKRFIRNKQPQHIIDEAIKNKPKPNPDEIVNFVDSRMEKLRTNFRQEQKSSVTEMRKSITIGDFETAHRLAHTLKGMAGLIKDDALVESALAVERLFKNKQLPNGELDTLERRLNRAISQIPAEPQIVPSGKLSKEEQQNLLENLEKHLIESDTTCLELVEKLSKVPESKILIRQIESIQFEAAIETLRTLRSILED